MKKQMFMALVATTFLSSIAMASLPSASNFKAEAAARKADNIEQGTVLPCGKLASNVKSTVPEKLIEPTAVAMAQPAKAGAAAKSGGRE